MKKIFIVYFLLIGMHVCADLIDDGLAAHFQGDYEQSHKFYSQACDKDEPKGCLALGSLYALGHGVERNINVAKKYFKKACDGGNNRGCLNFQAYDTNEVAK